VIDVGDFVCQPCTLGNQPFFFLASVFCMFALRCSSAHADLVGTPAVGYAR
jgi:hypothetical protein